MMAVTNHKAMARQTREESRRRIVDAATELVRDRSYAELNVGEIMGRAELGRTIFYRHFEDLEDLLLRVAREAVDELYAAQLALASTRLHHGPDAVRPAIELAVGVYERHGPVLRVVAEAAAGDELVATRQAQARLRFDGLVAQALTAVAQETGRALADVNETARALNLLAESYLLDAFGREPRVSVETAVQTLSEIWVALVNP
jgi:TetR/AcrR family transcriptional regulator, ethionamide resistance regulator